MPTGTFKNPKERAEKISKALKGRHLSPKTEFKKGHPSYLTAESKERMGIAAKARWEDDDYKRTISKKISGSRKGMQFSEEHIDNLRKAQKKKWKDDKYRQNMINAHLGKPRFGDPKKWKHTQKTKEKISRSKIGISWGSHTDQTKDIMSVKMKQYYLAHPEARIKLQELHKGDKCTFWKGGITSKNQQLRGSMEWRLWRESVFQRDNYACQCCGSCGCEIHPHHINNFSQHPQLRFKLENGITLCKDCHFSFHRRYGQQDNTMEQITKFIVGGQN